MTNTQKIAILIALTLAELEMSCVVTAEPTYHDPIESTIVR
jgi:hypothetical protein